MSSDRSPNPLRPVDPFSPMDRYQGSSRGNRWLPPLLVAAVLVALAGVWWVDPAGWGLPLCSFYRLTGWYCPGCGVTRATHDLLHGHLLAALRNNAFWIGLMPVALYAAASEARRMAGGRPLPGDLARQAWFYWTVATLAIVFLALRNLPTFPFTLLAPGGL